MLVNSGPAYVKPGRHRIDVQRISSYYMQDLPAGGVGYGPEGISSHLMEI